MPMHKPMFAALAGHAAMGAGLGLIFALALIWLPALHVKSSVAHGFEPWATVAIIVFSLTAMFGVNATLTGFLLTMSHDGTSARKGGG
jgi:small-conductance mechanosensitive channel